MRKCMHKQQSNEDAVSPVCKIAMTKHNAWRHDETCVWGALSGYAWRHGYTRTVPIANE